MKNTKFSRFLAMLLAVVMVASMIPMSVFAADPATYTKITSADELVTGKYVMVLANGKAPSVLDGSWILAETPTIAGETPNITITGGSEWTITKNEDGSVKLADKSGAVIAPPTGNNNGVKAGDYNWAVSFANGTFQFKGQGEDTTTLCLNGGAGKFRAYRNATITGNPAGYPVDFTLYKSNAAGTVDPESPTEGTTSGTTDNSTGANTDPTDPAAPVVTPIKDALAAAKDTELTVKGVVTLIEGSNIYVQDASGAICVCVSSKPTDIALGDTIIGTGKRAAFNGTPQLGSAKYEKSEGMTLIAKATTIDKLTKADICTYVQIKGLEVTDVFDNDGAFSNPNITVKDSNGNSIQIYKAVVDKDEAGAWAVKVGDMIDVKAAVGYYEKGDTAKFQLRNTIASEITPADTRENGLISDLKTLMDGDKVVIFNPANNKALSSVYPEGKFYNSAVDVELTEGKLTGYNKDALWTVGINEDGTYTFSTAEGKKISMDATHGSMGLDKENLNWEIKAVEATADQFHIMNVNRKAYMEYQPKFNTWSAYKTINEEEKTMFAQQLYLVVNEETEPEAPNSDLPKAGDNVVIYNLAAEGVMGLQNDNAGSPAVLSTHAVIGQGDVVNAENGAVVFTVEKEGDWYRFKNEAFGYLCSNGGGKNSFYAKDLAAKDDAGIAYSESSCWKLAPKNGGFTMESRTAKFQGKYTQYMEYFSGCFQTYRTNKVDNWDIFTFKFYPLANTDNLHKGVVNEPSFDYEGKKIPDAYVGADYKLELKPNFAFGVNAETLVCNFDKTFADGILTVTVPTAKVDTFKTAGKFDIVLSGEDNENIPFEQTISVAVKDEPLVVKVTPAPNAETGAGNFKPVISAEFANIGEGAKVTMTINDKEVKAELKGNVVTYKPAEDMAEGRTTVIVNLVRADGKKAQKVWSFTVGEAQFQLYFGQLHAHTAEYSDGAGTLQEGLDYVKNLPEDANVDFVSFTDHSNYFDTKSAAIPEQALYDMSLAPEESQKTWKRYKDTVAAFNNENNGIVAIAGFEMTWSGGPGHINTFNTPGIVSRNNTVLNNKTDDKGLRAYYALLSQEEGIDSLNQFNHPGKTFGNFKDFNYWDPIIDSRMYTVEVGNGEGQIGAGGYYPSYEQYIMALDKGWHVAPTNNQDNHKGKWGNANDARDVILTDNFSEEGIYDAIRQLHVYATEDKNLEITYTVNDQQMGHIFKEIPEKLNMNVTVFDPNESDVISKVEVVANSGKVVHTWSDAAELTKGELTCSLNPDYSYYFIRVTQSDGDLAVTAPVWVGETLKIGISAIQPSVKIPVTGEEMTLTTTFFNSEDADATVKSVTYTANGSEVLATVKTPVTVKASSTQDVEWKYTPTKGKITTIKVTAVIEQDGKEYTYSKEIELDVRNSEKLVYIGIDASHYNEYVAGNYKDSMGNFSNLASEYSVRTVELKTSEELIAACKNPKYKAMILTAPSRRLEAAQKDPRFFSADELKAIAEFNNKGGMVIVAGWSDHYESAEKTGWNPNPGDKHMAETQNELLEALGSSLRINDDATYDDEYSAIDGCELWRLYFNSYGKSFLTEGVEVDPEHDYDRLYTEVFSHYGGASVQTVDGKLPESVTPIVFGHASTYSVDADGDGLGGEGKVFKYPFKEGDDRLMIMATEQLEGKGLIIVSGAAFMSNFEVQAKIEDNAAEKNYANYKICQNLVEKLHPMEISKISDIHAVNEEGYRYIIEGQVTANASGYDKDTAFFDCTYVQDETGGINVFPVAGSYKIGDIVRVSGVTKSYNGEPELSVTKIEKIGDAEKPLEAKKITTKQLNSREFEGSLVTISGTVTKFNYALGLVESIYVKDESGEIARVFIDGYITKNAEIDNLRVGTKITATGLASYDDTYAIKNDSFVRLRIRNRADIKCDKLEYNDIKKDAFYAEAVDYMSDMGYMYGTEIGTYAPNEALTRAQLVTILYRIAGEPTITYNSNEFTDVSNDAYYINAVIWASDRGIVNGYAAGNGYKGNVFLPNEPVSRQEFAVFVYRYAKSVDPKLASPDKTVLNKFSDKSGISGFAQEAMAWTVSANIIGGYKEGYVYPHGPAARGESATMLYRYLAPKG